MNRVGQRWWLVGIALVLATLLLARAFYDSESGRKLQQQRAMQRQVVNVLADDVHDVLHRQLALARVISTVGLPARRKWPALANIVTSQSAATGAGFIVPVTERDRGAFERRTGLTLFESPRPGIVSSAPRQPLYLVDVDSWSKTTKPVLGLDLADNPLRRELMLRAAAQNRQLATPPVEFLGRVAHLRGVIVYVPVRARDGRLEGWVTASYQASPLGAAVSAAMPGAGLTIRDGSATLLSRGGPITGSPTSVLVAGRTWSVWASVQPTGGLAIPWLILAFGLVLSAGLCLLLRQAVSRERYAARRLAEHDAEEAALSRIATTVAEGGAPEQVLALVAKELGVLLGARTAAVSRFDPASNSGLVIGGWAAGRQELAGARFDLDGGTASAAVYRTGRPTRTAATYEHTTDPIAPLMGELGATGGIAAPIVVDGKLWGAIGSAYGESQIPPATEDRLERFGRLVGLAIANAAAREQLDRQASTDSLTGIANRRSFDDRLRSELSRVRRHQAELSLALIDIDHFKRINDEHGHQVGDEALAGFARRLADHARKEDLVARVGGEEFVWLMPDTDEEDAYRAAERLRVALGQGDEGQTVQITISIGIAGADPESSAASLMRRTDTALYEAKRSGRNVTRLADAGSSEAVLEPEHS